MVEDWVVCSFAPHHSLAKERDLPVESSASSECYDNGSGPSNFEIDHASIAGELALVFIIHLPYLSPKPMLYHETLSRKDIEIRSLVSVLNCNTSEEKAEIEMLVSVIL
ncbi:hypothetical protein VNO78_02821 [Psophocarpus tetragonolobus]|uniref:Uncharacterized protein n=1 Tax=Psophocarpus tetragonolobus TaxID=3891 RepID=A0AAN9T366_PSOTE